MIPTPISPKILIGMHFSAIFNRIILSHLKGPPQKWTEYSILLMRMSVLQNKTQWKTNLMQLTLYNCSDNRADVLRVIDSMLPKWECGLFFFPSLFLFYIRLFGDICFGEYTCALTGKPKRMQWFQMPF